MTGKESFLLLENKIIFNSKEYKKDCEFVNLKTGERINCKYVIAQVDKDLEQLELIKKNDGIAKKLNQLEKIKTIIDDYEKYKLKPYRPANDYVRQIKEVLNNE
jgi:hypothetical protein